MDKNINDVEYLDEECFQYYSLDYILEHFDELDFNRISINPHELYRGENNYDHIHFTNKEHPFAVGDFVFDHRKTLYINKEYYFENKEKIDLLLTKIIYKIKNKLCLSGIELINNNILINAVICNEKLNSIDLEDELNKYDLSKELFDRLCKNSHIEKIESEGVEEELEHNFDSRIAYNAKYLDSFRCKLNELPALKELEFDNISSITDEDMSCLHLLSNDCIIRISNFPKEDNFKDIKRIFDTLNNHNMTNEVIIELPKKDKMQFNNTIKYSIGDNQIERVTIDVYSRSYGLKQYIEYESRLNDMIKPALNLSPLERFLYAYNIVKQFKPYKENEDDKDQARNIYEILDNDYIVCRGYTSLLKALLDRLGIKSEEYGLDVNTGFDSIKESDIDVGNNKVEYESHSRIEIKIIDPKYGINGIYISDPTWDNDMEKDLYIHALMTRKEHDSMNRENKFDERKTILDADSIEVFYSLVNRYLDGKNQHLSTIMIFLTNYLKDFNINLYEELINKYPQIINNSDLLTDEQLADIIEQIGYFVVNTNNNTIKPSTIYAAVSEVYKAKGMSDEEINTTLEKTIIENSKQYEEAFPKRKRIYADGNEEIHMNDDNKFNEEEIKTR